MLETLARLGHCAFMGCTVAYMFLWNKWRQEMDNEVLGLYSRLNEHADMVLQVAQQMRAVAKTIESKAALKDVKVIEKQMLKLTQSVEQLKNKKG